LGGAYERPKIVEDLEMALGELAIEWVPVPDASPAIGHTLAECAFRARTGITIIAILREPEPVRTLAQTFAWGATVAVCVAVIVNGAFVAATMGVPNPRLYPAVMERVKTQRQEKERVTNAHERYNPYLPHGELLELAVCAVAVHAAARIGEVGHALVGEVKVAFGIEHQVVHALERLLVVARDHRHRLAVLKTQDAVLVIGDEDAAVLVDGEAVGLAVVFDDGLEVASG
jgi:hypothetical protein